MQSNRSNAINRYFNLLLHAGRARPSRGTSGRSAFRTLRLERLASRCLLTHGAVAGLGVAGDSLSDEYRGESYDYARSWVELLADERQVEFGRLDDWGEPRRNGYEYNWARSGATSTSLLAEGQHSALAGQISSRQVDHALLAVGQNDFSPAGSAYLGIYFGSWSQQKIDQHVDTVVQNLDTSLATLTAGDAHVVVSNIIDYGVAGVTRQYLTSAARRQKVTHVIERVNARLVERAEDYGVPVVNNFQFANDFFGTNSSPIPSQTIGGVEITNTAGTEPTNAFVDDGVHPHMVLQSGLANVFMKAFNVGHAAQFRLFSEAEMVALGDLTYGGQDTFSLDYGDYIILRESPPWQNPSNRYDVNADGVAAPLDVLIIINELQQPSFADAQGRLPLPHPSDADVPYLDVNGDGFVTVIDALNAVNFLNEQAEHQSTVPAMPNAEPEFSAATGDRTANGQHPGVQQRPAWRSVFDTTFSPPETSRGQRPLSAAPGSSPRPAETSTVRQANSQQHLPTLGQTVLAAHTPIRIQTLQEQSAAAVDAMLAETSLSDLLDQWLNS